MTTRFTMTDSHLEAFAAQQRERFEDEMVVHLRKEFPEEFRKMGEARMRELIREGISSADSYNLVLEYDVARYIELMVAVSPNFDDSPKTPWAEEILTDEELTGREKIYRLYEHVMFEQTEDETEEARR